MVDVQELVVRATPEGVGDVSDQLDGMTESVEESGEEMEDTADGFSDLQSRFQGAGAAFAGAIAVTAGAFMGRVPILAETTDALGAVFDSLGLKLDSLLRGGLTKVNNFLFNLSDTIASVEGPVGNLIGLFAGIGAAAAGALSAFAGFKIASLGLVGGLKATGAALLTVGKFIGGLIAGIISIKAAIAIALAAIVGFVAAYLTNWRGTRDKTNAIIGQIIDFVVSGFNSLVSKGGKLLGKFVDKVTEFGSNVMSALVDKLGDIGSIAFSLGKKFVLALLSGVESVAQLIVDALTNILNANISAINTIIETLPDQVSSRLSIDTVDKIEAPSVSGTVNTAVDEGQDFIGSVGGGRGTINLDGRDVENTQGRYRADNLHRRGG